LRDGMTGS